MNGLQLIHGGGEPAREVPALRTPSAPLRGSFEQDRAVQMARALHLELNELADALDALFTPTDADGNRVDLVGNALRRAEIKGDLAGAASLRVLQEHSLALGRAVLQASHWPEPPVAPEFIRRRNPHTAKWRDLLVRDFLEHEITPCEHSPDYIYRCVDAETRDLMTFGEDVAWKKFPTYSMAVMESLVWASRTYPDPEDGGGSDEGAMEAAIPFRCPATGYVEDTVQAGGVA